MRSNYSLVGAESFHQYRTLFFNISKYFILLFEESRLRSYHRLESIAYNLKVGEETEGDVTSIVATDTALAPLPWLLIWTA